MGKPPRVQWLGAVAAVLLTLVPREAALERGSYRATQSYTLVFNKKI